MDNSKEEEIKDKLLKEKEKYLNEKNNNLLELAKNINLYTNAKNEDIIEEKEIKNILIKAKHKLELEKNILNNKGLTLFEKMNILEENSKALKSYNKEINNEIAESILYNQFGIESYENFIFNDLFESNNIIKKNYLCEIHNKGFNSYCIDCNKNLCSHCVEYTELHKDHNINSFSKYILNKFDEEEFKSRYYSCYFSIKKLKEIILDICSGLIDINEIILKNKVKKAYIKYYKKNLYQIEYANFVYLRYIFHKKISLLNYQVLVNLLQIKFNNVVFPDSVIDIKEKAYKLINFLSKTENYILLSSDSPNTDKKININSKLIKELKKNLINKTYLLNNLKESQENNNIIIKNTDNDNEINEKITKNIIKNKIINEKLMKNSINETKITTTTSIYLSNSSLKSDNSKNIIGKKKEKIIKKFTKRIITNKIYNKAEKIYKEIGEQFYNEILNFIENHPPLNDGIEVEFQKEIKYIYKDKINDKIIYSIYQGECQKGKQIRHGRGFFKWGDGEKYIGYWVNNKREGQGINYYSNGNIYEGMFKNGKKEGKGKYKWKNGDLYEGDWKNGVKEGEGVYYCNNGDYYKGLFSNDKINGQGVYIWKNENQYKGQFKNNYIEGEGIFYKKENKKDEDNNNSIIESERIFTYEKCLVKIIKE